MVARLLNMAFIVAKKEKGKLPYRGSSETGGRITTIA